MNKPTSRVLSPVALAVALSVAAFPAIAKDKKPDDMVAVGEPISCIMPNRVRSTHVRDDQTIDFEMINGDVYRNTLPYKCSSLGFEEKFSYRLSTNHLCSVDIIYVLHNYGWGLTEGPGCGLGTFQKMQKAEKK